MKTITAIASAALLACAACSTPEGGGIDRETAMLAAAVFAGSVAQAYPAPAYYSPPVTCNTFTPTASRITHTTCR